MIRVQGLQKRFGETRVLEGVDHVQKAGEVAVLIGPSGCGKSTFLRCLNQLEHPDAGSIEIDGLVVGPGADRKARTELRRRTGMVFQQFHLFPHFTVLGNVIEAPIHVAGMSRSDAIALARELLAKVGLADRADFHPSQLSGGQQQRVAIARALAMRPRVLLFDEPTSSLDPQLRGEVLTVLRDLAEEGRTMLLVTHEMGLAQDIADQVLFFDGGRVAESGSPEQVFGNPAHPRTREFLRGVAGPPVSRNEKTRNQPTPSPPES
jgi:ABC-type polar amino acid transport system ATPase subunit